MCQFCQFFCLVVNTGHTQTHRQQSCAHMARGGRANEFVALALAPGRASAQTDAHTIDTHRVNELGLEKKAPCQNSHSGCQKSAPNANNNPPPPHRLTRADARRICSCSQRRALAHARTLGGSKCARASRVRRRMRRVGRDGALVKIFSESTSAATQTTDVPGARARDEQPCALVF